MHALSLLNGCLEDSLTAHVKRLGTSSELTSATADSSRMRDVLAHLMSLAVWLRTQVCMFVRSCFWCTHAFCSTCAAFHA
jgi:hypothetical protein